MTEPQTETCPYCGQVIMRDNATVCDCGVLTCDGCWELHVEDCQYARHPTVPDFGPHRCEGCGLYVSEDFTTIADGEKVVALRPPGRGQEERRNG